MKTPKHHGPTCMVNGKIKIALETVTIPKPRPEVVCSCKLSVTLSSLTAKEKRAKGKKIYIFKSLTKRSKRLYRGQDFVLPQSLTSLRTYKEVSIRVLSPPAAHSLPRNTSGPRPPSDCQELGCVDCTSRA